MTVLYIASYDKGYQIAMRTGDRYDERSVRGIVMAVDTNHQ